MLDLVFALRVLRRSPGSTAVVVLSLALGTGGSTAIFSVIDAVLVRPFPYTTPDRIVGFSIQDPKTNRGRGAHTLPEYHAIRDRNQVFEFVTATYYLDALLTGTAEPESVNGRFVSTNTFQMLGIAPLLGRTLQPEDAGRPVAILSYALWRRRFGQDPQTLGRTLRVNDENYTVIGVMPPRFTWRGGAVWMPLPENPGPAWNNRFVNLRARLKPGVTLEQASADLTTLHQPLAVENPKLYPRDGFRIFAFTLTDSVVGGFRATLYTLAAAVGLLLLIACGNAANLLLARAAGRWREISIRIAIGASRFHLLRGLLTESLLLALSGGLLGVLAAHLGLNALVSLIPPGPVPDEAVISINPRVLLFSLALSVLTAVLFGLAPLALSPHRPRRHVALSRPLVVAEIALSLLLLCGAALMIRSFAALYSARYVAHPENVLTFVVSLPASRYPTLERRNAFFQEALRRVSSLPFVQTAAITNGFPPFGGFRSGFTLEGQPPSDSARLDLLLVSEDFCRLIGVPLLRGRPLTEQDILRGERVALLSESLVKRYWPAGDDPLGRRLSILQPALSTVPFEIIGVVADTRQPSLQDEALPSAYLPYTVFAPPRQHIALRAASPLSLLPAVRAEIQALDRDQPLSQIDTLDGYYSIGEQQPRFAMILFAAFAAVGLTLAAAGIYSVMSYSVTRRTHEIGIRMALGAQRQDIARLLLASGLKLTLAGLTLGQIASLSLSRLLANQLYRIRPNDPLAFFAVSLLLTTVALLACLLPARRAANLDPCTSLRHE